ncbi:Rv3235 family protein [Kribbella sp. NPDC051770]|uniref:Rv3235 family protein n=1 Tax=Kribbella sp. NPDC051770 TaxID=3155413 RepID=UPI0034374033
MTTRRMLTAVPSAADEAGKERGDKDGARTYPMGATGVRKPVEVVPTQGALALRYEADEVPPARPVLRLVPGGAGAPEVRGLPEVREWATRLVQAIAETIGGDRPVSQLLRWTDTAVYFDVHRRVRLLGLTTTAGKRAAKERSAVRSVHVCRPENGVAEIAAHLRTGGRSRAMALRLEVRRGRWVCTALELG